MSLLFKSIKSSSILDSFQCSDSEVNGFENNWHKDIKLHSTNNGCTNVTEPLSIEIWVCSEHIKWFNKTFRKLSRKISCTKHWKYSCIEELTNEHNICYKLQLDGFGITSTIGHDQRNNCSDNKIDNNDQIFNCVVLHNSFKVLVNVFLAHLSTDVGSILGFPFVNFVLDF